MSHICLIVNSSVLHFVVFIITIIAICYNSVSQIAGRDPALGHESKLLGRLPKYYYFIFNFIIMSGVSS